MSSTWRGRRCSSRSGYSFCAATDFDEPDAVVRYIHGLALMFVPATSFRGSPRGTSCRRHDTATRRPSAAAADRADADATRRDPADRLDPARDLADSVRLWTQVGAARDTCSSSAAAVSATTRISRRSSSKRAPRPCPFHNSAVRRAGTTRSILTAGTTDGIRGGGGDAEGIRELVMSRQCVRQCSTVSNHSSPLITQQLLPIPQSFRCRSRSTPSANPAPDSSGLSSLTPKAYGSDRK